MRWSNEGFFDGHADMPTSWLVVNGYYLMDHADEVRAMYGVQAGGPTLVRSYEVEERTESAYAQVDMQFGEKL